jgi:UDP-N-acetylmuramate--alanine ligase
MIKRMRRIHCVHFVGIGGSGMSGIAEVMLSLGYKVQGSDLKANKQTRRLADQGATIFIGHAAGNIDTLNSITVADHISR